MILLSISFHENKTNIRIWCVPGGALYGECGERPQLSRNCMEEPDRLKSLTRKREGVEAESGYRQICVDL